MTRPKLPASPLASIVARAANNLPQNTGATAQALALNSARGGIVLADISASMAERAGSRSKIEALNDALASVPHDWRIVAFADTVCEIRPGERLPTPYGGTALDHALKYIASYQPKRILVISDGHPDYARGALDAADLLSPVRIDVVYCGPDNDREGQQFMRQLARGGGRLNVVRPDHMAITSAIRLALPGGERA